MMDTVVLHTQTQKACTKYHLHEAKYIYSAKKWGIENVFPVY